MNKDRIDLLRSELTKPVVIIGMMGAGKTTLAKKLSACLERDFLDSDQEIERDENRTVREIFQNESEAYFRRKEKEKIAHLLSRLNIILSVGGGAITDPQTADLIFARSLCLWVDAPIETLAHRTGHQNSRPLLAGRNAEDVLTERMAQRKHLYERAHLKIDGAHHPDVVAQNAMRQIADYLLQNRNAI